MNAVMHSSLKLGGQSIVASQGHVGGKPDFKGFALSLAVRTEGEADKLFAAMSEGGQVTQPLIRNVLFAEVRYADRWKFGVNWMVLVSQG